MNEPRTRQFFGIVGVGRSGTSLLMSMLNAHPEIVLPPETHFLGSYVMRHPKISVDVFQTLLAKDHRFERLGFSAGEIDKVIADIQGDFSAAGFYWRMLEHYASIRDAQIIGDKAPKNIEYLPVIRRLFSTARIIHIIRDPRDVYLSRTKAKWSSGYSDTAHFVAYRSQYTLGTRLGARIFGDRYYQLRYEDLLSNPERELRSICSWLGVNYREEMLQFSRSAQELVSAEEEAWKKETLGPLLRDNRDKWKRELDRGKVWAIEAACSPAFRDGCYQRSASPASILRRFWFKLVEVYITTLSILYRIWVLLQNYRVQRAYRNWSS